MESEIVKDFDFSYFNENNSIFNDKEILNDDKSDNNSEQESTNTSFESKNNEIDDNDEKELKLLPLNLLNIETNDFDLYLNEKNNKTMNKLVVNSEPFIPKWKLVSSNSKNISYIKNKINKNDKNKGNKKKKKNFCVKKGDWTCYICKNLNFSFRHVCNRCKLSKEESDKKYDEVFKSLEKIYNKDKENTEKNR